MNPRRLKIQIFVTGDKTRHNLVGKGGLKSAGKDSTWLGLQEPVICCFEPIKGKSEFTSLLDSKLIDIHADKTNHLNNAL